MSSFETHNCYCSSFIILFFCSWEDLHNNFKVPNVNELSPASFLMQQWNRKHCKDERHFWQWLWVCNFAGLYRWVMASFLCPREKRWCVSSLMCLTSADLVSRTGSSRGQQISFSCVDVMSRHWVDTGQCWGSRTLTDDDHSTILIVFRLLRCALYLPVVSTAVFFCRCLTVYQVRPAHLVMQCIKVILKVQSSIRTAAKICTCKFM